MAVDRGRDLSLRRRPLPSGEPALPLQRCPCKQKGVAWR
jgi:hypothetical protein